MLFKQKVLEGIEAGRVTVAFRRWKRPTVKAGGSLLTGAGLLAIQKVERIEVERLRPMDARKAGFDSLEELLHDLQSQRAELLYRIQFVLAGPDPRIALREGKILRNDDFEKVRARLTLLDERSTVGKWTRAVLEMIGRFPERSAGELAEQSGYEKEWLKINIRKLKNLGLTESLNPGYRLSPRGEIFLNRWAKKN